jgi:hypothetical protein
MTNMKRTLAHSPLALDVYMTWYPLRDEVASFLGDRLTGLFAHAISTRATGTCSMLLSAKTAVVGPFGPTTKSLQRSPLNFPTMPAVSSLGVLKIVEFRAVATVRALRVMRQAIRPAVAVWFSRDVLKTQNVSREPNGHFLLKGVAGQPG